MIWPDTPDYVPPWALKFREWGIKQFSGIEADHKEQRATFTAIFTKHAEMRAFWEAVPDSISERDGLDLLSVFVFGVDDASTGEEFPFVKSKKSSMPRASSPEEAVFRKLIRHLQILDNFFPKVLRSHPPRPRLRDDIDWIHRLFPQFKSAPFDYYAEGNKLNLKWRSSDTKLGQSNVRA